MNKCSKCGTEFEGKFCPECGTKYEATKICSVCGAQQKAAAKFCTECGSEFEKATESVSDTDIDQIAQAADSEQSPQSQNDKCADEIERQTVNSSVEARIAQKELATRPITVIAIDGRKILKYLPLVLFGLWAALLWAFYAAIIVKSDGFFVERNVNLYDMLKERMMSDMFDSARALISFAAISDAYFLILTLVYWKSNRFGRNLAASVSFVLHIAIIVCASVLSKQCKEFTEGFEELYGNLPAVVISLTAVFAFLQACAVFASWYSGRNDPEEQKEPKPNKRQSRTSKFVAKSKMWVVAHKMWSVVIVCVLLVAIVLSIVLPITLCNNFRVGKVSQIEFGDSREKVKKILGEPNEYTSSDSTYHYYSNNAERIFDKIQSLTQHAASPTELREQIEQLHQELLSMDYKQIVVTFDSSGGVSSVAMSLHSLQTESEESENKFEVKKVEPIPQFVENLTENTPLGVRVLFKNGNYQLRYITGYELSSSLSIDGYDNVGWHIKYSAETDTSSIQFELDVYKSSFQQQVEDYFADIQRAERLTLTLAILPAALVLCGMAVVSLGYASKLPSKKYVLLVVAAMYPMLVCIIGNISPTYTNVNWVINYLIMSVIMLPILAMSIVNRVISGKIYRRNLLNEQYPAVSKYNLQMSGSFIAYLACATFVFMDFALSHFNLLGVQMIILCLVAFAEVGISGNNGNGINIASKYCNLLFASIFVSTGFAYISRMEFLSSAEGATIILVEPESFASAVIASIALNFDCVFAVVFIVLTSIALRRNAKALKVAQDPSDKKTLKRHIAGESVFLSVMSAGLLWGVCYVLGTLWWRMRNDVFQILLISSYLCKMTVWGVVIYAVVSLSNSLMRKYENNRKRKAKMVTSVSLVSIGIVAMFLGGSSIRRIQNGDMILRLIIIIGLIAALIEVLVTFIVKRVKKETDEKAYVLETATDDLLLTLAWSVCCFLL